MTSSVPDEVQLSGAVTAAPAGLAQLFGSQSLRCDRAVCEHTYHLNTGPLPVLVCAHCHWWTHPGRGKPTTCTECRNHHGRDVALQPALMHFTERLAS